ncbi:nucleotidyltransferase family protein [Mesorhizobium sp. KR9-304]|uniref:nucleotidyltransferase family protein n=1 Tax=Mesorhizobium sp. KR9-304 TaxID=3156614 RepID=UPI0032B3A9AE
MLRLSAEDSILLMTCRAYLRPEDDDRLRRLCGQPVNWAYIVWRAENNRTVPLVEYHLRRLGLLASLPAEALHYIQCWTALSKIRSVLEFRNLPEILDALDREGISWFLVKGPDLSLLYYPDPLLRPMTDLDIMVNPADAQRVQRVMLDLGYRHGIFDPSNGDWHPERKELDERSFRDTYSLPVFVRIESVESPFPAAAVPRQLRYRHVKGYIDGAQKLHMPIFIDMHVNLSVGMDVQDIWSGVGLAKGLGRILRVQSVTGAVWFLSARLYHEAFLYNSLRLLMFGDLHAVLHKELANVNWAEVAAIAYKYEMRPAIYFVLEQMRRICGIDIPPAFLDLIRPDQGEVPLQHDWGDILPKLLSVPNVTELELA